MLRDYQVVSPSLEGVLSHESMTYEGIIRPKSLLKILDAPNRKMDQQPLSEHDQIVLHEYFHDLYGVFMKKLSVFVIDSDIVADEAIKLQAMLQEMIKVRKLIREGKNERENDQKH